MRAPGKLITVEGVDGAGKTTLVGALAASLGARGVEVRVLREPGGVETSERIRSLVKDPALTVGARTETLLYAAARAQLVEEALRPALEAGEWVLLDRFLDSSLAYQGAGRGLGIEAVRELNMFATGGIAPDRTLLLMLEPAAARSRMVARSGGGEAGLSGDGDAEQSGDRVESVGARAPGEPMEARDLDEPPEPAEVRAPVEPPDRLEREDDAFFERIAAAYRSLAAAEPERIRVIDATGTPAEVLADALAALDDLLTEA